MPHNIGRSHGSRVPQRRADSSCATGGFYKSPTASQTIPYTTPVKIAWDTNCLNCSTVDIFLYAPATGSRIHAFQEVDFPSGSYETSLQPKWWNDTASVSLQFTIVCSGQPPFLSTYAAGPIFSMTYTAPTSGSAPASADLSKADNPITVVKNALKHLSGGKVAAAVIMPLLVVTFLCVMAYIKLRRDRGKEKRKQWNEAIDKRMSTISTDWKPISAVGAQAAIRSSIAVDGSIRSSSFSFGNIRPDSTVAVEGGQAGIGRSRTVLPGQSNGTAQLRSSAINARTVSERVSRVSFAPDVRQSSDSRRVQSRAYHTAIVPPLPDRKWEITTDSDADGTISPTQTDGPQTLSIEDIQARLAGKDTSTSSSVDAVMPALRLMRTSDPSGALGEEGSHLLFSAQSAAFPAVPSPTHNPHSPEPASAMSSFMPMQPMPAGVMSPDDMLRAYAERRAAAAAGGPAAPPPAYTGPGAQQGGGMRTLYSPTQAQTQAAATTDPLKRATVGTIASQYSGYADEDAYSGAT